MRREGAPSLSGMIPIITGRARVRSELLEQRRELGEGAGAMRLRVLLCGGHLGDRALAARLLAVGDEDRVVAESALPRGGEGEAPRPTPLDDALARRVTGHD